MKTLTGVRNPREALGKLGKRVVVVVATAIITAVITYSVFAILSSEQPLFPSITTSPGLNPIWNTGDTQSIGITVAPAFEPPYRNNIKVAIPNPNNHKCYMVLELELSEGFSFLPITATLPPNVTVGEGYEYKSVMRLYIDDFAPQFDLSLDLPVYTMNPDAFSGTEEITPKVLVVQPQK